MKAAGIIAEYNPFHNGHQYHMDEVKKQTGADYIIVVLSGNFTQRGGPAMIHKYARAKMALLAGADLVLELPLYYSCGSAEYFAEGAVSLLRKTGVVSAVGFGSECGDLDCLCRLASLFNEEPQPYRDALKDALRGGKTYPQARQAAVAACLPEYARTDRLLTSPNNILGIEYCRAIERRGSMISPFTVKRKGDGYHEAGLSSETSSALALRTALSDGGRLEALKGRVPGSIYGVLEENWGKTFPIFDRSLSPLMQYKLLLNAPEGFSGYVDISHELSDRIKNLLPSYQNYAQFVNLLKTKDITYTRVSRSLIHILLNMRKEKLERYINMDYTPYARILGLRKSSAKLLNAIKNNSEIPLLSKLADAKGLLSGDEYGMLLDDVNASHIYNSLITAKYGTVMKNEFSQEIQIVP